jgi:hypothetical protein
MAYGRKCKDCNCAIVVYAIVVIAALLQVSVRVRLLQSAQVVLMVSAS